MTSLSVEPVALSYDQLRRKVRQELHLKRVQDRDNSEMRLATDALMLDTQLVNAGYVVSEPTEWGSNNLRSSLQPRMGDLNTEVIAVVGED
jgi:hypothetical protein